jgi:hypothetical protein
MNEQELREMARKTLASLERLEIRDGLTDAEVEQTQRDIARTFAYWHQLAYPELYQRPAWYVRLWQRFFGRVG